MNMTLKPSPLLRKRRLLAVASLVALTTLQGCVPLVAGTAVGAGAMMAGDRRTSGAYVEDEGIEWRTSNRINERYGSRVHVNATSFNRNLLLTGEAPDEATKMEIGRIAAAGENVRSVTNDIQIGPNSTLSMRASDSMITSKVKARFIDSGRFSSQHVKVLTEAGVVYLMGVVTQREADAATEVARTTSGVRKVVRVFEYISEEEARRLDRPPAQQPSTGYGDPRGAP